MATYSEPDFAASTKDWYVQVEGQIYGPFDTQMLRNFIAEGRVTEHSLISQSLSQPFQKASRIAPFSLWLGFSCTRTEHSSQPIDEGAEDISTPALHLIMAEIRSGQSMSFLKVLQSHGEVQRVGDTVWLLKGSVSSSDLMTQLTQALTSHDRVFVADVTGRNPVSFNLGQTVESGISALFTPHRSA